MRSVQHTIPRWTDRAIARLPVENSVENNRASARTLTKRESRLSRILKQGRHERIVHNNDGAWLDTENTRIPMNS